MNRTFVPLAVMALAACNQNTSSGADREAQVDTPAKPASQMRAAEALAGIATEAIGVETMTEADLASLGRKAGDCRILLTEVAKHSLVYEEGVRATIKLNDKLITLPHSRASTYSDGGLEVRLREVEGRGDAGLAEEEMVVIFPGAADEHGFRGYRKCEEDFR